jgi:hypothetical protein
MFSNAAGGFLKTHSLEASEGVGTVEILFLFRTTYLGYIFLCDPNPEYYVIDEIETNVSFFTIYLSCYEYHKDLKERGVKKQKLLSLKKKL